jgi:hypothetical protein
MPSTPPPAGAASPEFNYYTVPSCQRLWRVHSMAITGVEFLHYWNRPANWNGRFDPTPEDDYPFMYLAATQRGALAETVLRDTPFSKDGLREIRIAEFEARHMSCLLAMRSIRLISLLSSEDLAHAWQDHWLIQADREEFDLTRKWATWFREKDPQAQGITWLSRRDLGVQLFLLFGDRCTSADLTQDGPSIRLYDESATRWLVDLIDPLRFKLVRS